MDWKEFLIKNKIKVLLISLVVLVIIVNSISPIFPRYLFPSIIGPPLQDGYSFCEILCEDLSAREFVNLEHLLNHFENVIPFCQDPRTDDSIDGDCRDYIGECEVILRNGTTVMVGCD